MAASGPDPGRGGETDDGPPGFVVGLTGGVGSGKSTVSELFAALGAAVVDTDRIARDIVAPGTPGLAAVTAAFGPPVVATGGGLDRGALRRLVFADAGARRRLEALLHPLIRAEARRRLAAARGPYAMLVVPLLAEHAGSYPVDRVLVVDVTRETQIARTAARDRIPAVAAERMVAAQATREQRLAIADDVIDNEAAPERLPERVAALHRRYLAMATRLPARKSK